MALSQVAQHSGRRVVLPIIQQAADVIFAWELPAVCHIEQSAPESGSVAVLPYDTLPQASFTNLMLCANLVINRSIQSNAFAETLIARLPQLVMTIPAAGYMDAELMAESMPLGHFRYNQPVEALAAEITRLLDDSAYREQSGGSLWSLFDRMYASPETNFGHVLARFAGVAGEKLHKL
jgi:hypothetical protein